MLSCDISLTISYTIIWVVGLTWMGTERKVSEEESEPLLGRLMMETKVLSPDEQQERVNLQPPSQD